MKKTILAASLVAFTLTTSVAQKLKTYAKLVYVKTQQENPDVTVMIESPVATEKYLKFKIKIVNKTNDYIIYKPAETKLVVNGKEYKCTDKQMIISPLDNDSKVINFPGEGFNSARSCSYVIDGLYKVAPKGSTVEAPDFKLPVTKYDFTAGNFTITSTKLYKQSDATVADFTVSYTGDKIGCVNFTNATVLMPDGNEYVSKKPTGLFSKSTTLLLEKGGSGNFTLSWDKIQPTKAMDMQFVPMTIKWHETFNESGPKPEGSMTLNLEIDETLSK